MQSPKPWSGDSQLFVTLPIEDHLLNFKKGTCTRARSCTLFLFHERVKSKININYAFSIIVMVKFVQVIIFETIQKSYLPLWLWEREFPERFVWSGKSRPECGWHRPAGLNRRRKEVECQHSSVYVCWLQTWCDGPSEVLPRYCDVLPPLRPWAQLFHPSVASVW